MDKAHVLHLKAFNALVSEHQDSLYNIAYRALGNETAAQETTQAAVIHAYQTLDRLPDASVKLWLLRSLVIQCRQYFRQLPASSDHPVKDLQTCLASLPLDLCLVITLVDLEGLDYDQAARVLGQPRRQVRKHLAEARQMMAERLAVHKGIQ